WKQKVEVVRQTLILLAWQPLPFASDSIDHSCSRPQRAAIPVTAATHEPANPIRFPDAANPRCARRTESSRRPKIFQSAFENSSFPLWKLSHSHSLENHRRSIFHSHRKD